jgi:acetyl-CoA carboxylase carboxyl transferase subunit alpha
MDKKELLNHRRLKFRSIGGFQEGIPVEPERKRNMKPSENYLPKTADMVSELDNLKKILEAGPSNPTSIEAVEKLKQDVNQEISRAFISMGLLEKFESIKAELSKAPNPPDRNVKEDMYAIMHEFKQNLLQPGAYLGLKYKLAKLRLISRFIEITEKSKKLKAEINQKIPPDIKAKMEVLKNAQEKLSKGDSIEKDLAEEVERARKELEEILKSANLDIVGVTKRKVATSSPDLRNKIVELNKEIEEEIERVIDEAGLRSKLKALKEEIAKGSTSKGVEKLQAEIKEEILAALDVSVLKEKVDNLGVELASSTGRATEGKVGTENGRW